MNTLQFNNQSIRLDRIPVNHSLSLRAWDAADEYLLNHCLEEGLIPPSSIDDAQTTAINLVVNDAFGALALALQPQSVTSWSDSFLSQIASRHNAEINRFDDLHIRFLPGSAPPTPPSPDTPFTLVLLKIPKSMTWWEEQLRNLRPHLHADTKIISAGMVKHTPMRAWQLLEEIIGPTRTSRAQKKARLAFTELSQTDEKSGPLGSTSDLKSYRLENDDLDLVSFPNVFSASRLDAGTRLLLEHLPRREEALQIADLGCGNGVMSLVIAKRCPQAKVLAVDESFQAVACTKENALNAQLETRIHSLVSDGLTREDNDSFDMVICNPPFHQSQVTGDQSAWDMFHQARRKLKPGGEFWIVGNRHLGYHTKLKRLFGNCKVMGSDKKFVVLVAERPLHNEF
jgi:23S rRNA (guanine1835-N2)-methyltransferase